MQNKTESNIDGVSKEKTTKMGDTGRSEEINLLNHCQMKNTEHGFTCVADFLR